MELEGKSQMELDESFVKDSQQVLKDDVMEDENNNDDIMDENERKTVERFNGYRKRIYTICNKYLLPGIQIQESNPAIV